MRQVNFGTANQVGGVTPVSPARAGWRRCRARVGRVAGGLLSPKILPSRLIEHRKRKLANLERNRLRELS
jgi:hypothetical protein